MPLKLGKLPARELEPNIKRFSLYRDEATMPEIKIPSGHANTYANWGMFGNGPDSTIAGIPQADIIAAHGVGDCTIAGPEHETMNWTDLGAGGKTGDIVVPFTGLTAISDYSAVTKYDPSKTASDGSNPTDNGANVQDVINYRISTGIIDSKGIRHKIAASVAINLKNWQELQEAIYVFDAVGIGINFPSSAMTQFNNGEPWDVVSGATIEGGHYICALGNPSETEIAIVTWGKRVIMTQAFYEEYADEVFAYVSQEALDNGKTYEGFDLAQLQSDLDSLNSSF